jgi:hypothetical protein
MGFERVKSEGVKPTAETPVQEGGKSVTKQATPTAEIPVEEGKTTEVIPEVTVEGTKQGYQVLSGDKRNVIGDIRQEASEARAAGKDSFTKETVKDGKKTFTLVDATASDDFGRPGFKSASITLPEGTKLTIEDVMPALKAGLKGEKIEPIKIGEKAEVKLTEATKPTIEKEEVKPTDVETKITDIQKNLDLANKIEKARSGDKKAQEELTKFGIKYDKNPIYRHVSESEVNALNNGEQIEGKFKNGRVDVTTNSKPSTGANAEYRITFNDTYDFNKGDKAKVKNEELGDGWIAEGGYNKGDVLRIEKRNEDGSYTSVYEGKNKTVEGELNKQLSDLQGDKTQEIKPTEVGKTENTEKQEAINKANKQRQSTIEKTSREWQEANIDTEEHPLIVGDKLAEGVIIKVGQVLDYTENKDGKLLGKGVPYEGIPIVTSIEDLGNLHKQGMVDVGVFNSKEEANKWLADRDARYQQSYKDKLSKIDAKYAETATLEGGKEEVKPTEVTKTTIEKEKAKSTEEISVYHGGEVADLSKAEVELYVSRDANQAKEYAKGNKGNVQEFKINKNDIAGEEGVRGVITELGLKSKEEGYDLSKDLMLHEIIDPRFDTSLNEKDLKKLFTELKKRGFKAIEFQATDLTGKDRNLTDIVVLNPKETLKIVKPEIPKFDTIDSLEKAREEEIDNARNGKEEDLINKKYDAALEELNKRKEIKPTEVKVTQDDLKKAEVKFTEAKAKYERARGKESKSIVDKLKDEAINAKSELDDIRNRVKVQEKVQPEVKPIEKEVFKSSQGHTVDIENGKLIVKDKKGEVLSDRASKKAIEEYAENFDYSKGEKAPEVPSEITNGRDAAKYVIEESSNPTEIAEIYASEDLLPKEGNPKFQAIAEYGLGRIKTSSYKNLGDANKIEKSMYLKIFSEENGLPIDVLAKSISDKYGINIEPKDVVDYIEKYSKGDKAVLEFKESDVALQAADKFNKLTGLDLNSELANKVIDNKLGKANKDQLEIIKQDYETAKQLEDAYWAEYEKTDGFTKESNISEANKPETAKESQKKLEEAYKDLTNIEKRQIINSKFEELLKELKIEKICPTD